MRHLRPANSGVGGGAVSRQEAENGEYCLIDYSSCPTSDVCWLMDMDNGCVARDNCIIDTM